MLNALRRIAATEDFDAHIAQMETGLGDFEKCRPFILTTMLETSLLFKPGTTLMETLVDSLLAARRPYGDLLLWPEKTEALLIDPSPSVAHTARAVRVLAGVQAIAPADPVQEALEQAVAWLIGAAVTCTTPTRSSSGRSRAGPNWSTSGTSRPRGW